MAATIVGRTRELDVLRRLVEGDGAVRRVVVAGPAGIGKTTLVDAAVRHAGTAGTPVIHCRPTRGERELPGTALADLLGQVPRDAVDELALTHQAAIEHAALGNPWSSGEHLVARATLEALRQTADHHRLVVAIDDVQWLDRPSETVLSFVLRRLDHASTAVLLAVRIDAPDDPLPFEADTWIPPPERLDVGPLDATELGEVIRGELGAAPARPHLEALATSSGGNPLLAVELERSRRSGRARALPSSVAAALEARIGELDDPALAAVQAASVALQPTVEMLVAAGVAVEGLTGARAAGIVRIDNRRVDFTHPLLATAVYEQLSDHERERLHRGLALLALDPIERGHHTSRAAPRAEDVRVLDDAAAAAADRADHAGAAAFHLAAARLCDPAGSHERELRAAAAFELCGDVAEALRLARRLLDVLPPGPERVQARRIAVAGAVGGELSYAAASAELQEALDECGDDARLRAELHLTVAEIESAGLHLDEAERHLRAATEIAGAQGLHDLDVASRAELAFTECMLGRDGVARAEAAFRDWSGTVLSPTGYTPRMILGCVSLHGLQFDAAEHLFRAEIEMAQERGLEAIEVMARAHRAEALIRAGRWAQALRDAEDAAAHARQAANEQIGVGTTFALAHAEALLGRLDRARALSEPALRTAEEAADTWFTISHRAVLGLVALTEDEPARAVDMLMPAWRLLVDHGFGDFSIFPVANVLGEALAESGDAVAALALADALRACPVGEQPWCGGVAARTAALAASVEGRHDDAVALVAEAVDRHASLPEPFERARTRHIEGVIARRARRQGAAREALTEALEQYDELGAARWAERAAADLSRLPGRRRADGNELTGTEQRVAELVAQGLSNKEVASRLFVTVRTVEANLTKIYAKLGVRSRTELTSRLRQ